MHVFTASDVSGHDVTIKYYILRLLVRHIRSAVVFS